MTFALFLVTTLMFDERPCDDLHAELVSAGFQRHPSAVILYAKIADHS
jgi:hypothetical protein